TVSLLGQRPTDWSYSIDGSPPVPYTSPFVVTKQGTVVLSFSGPGGSFSETVKIDSQKPSANLTSNAVVVVTPGDTVPALGFSCTDPTPGSGVASCLSSTNDFTIGNRSVTLSKATATDVAGNTDTKGQTAVVVDGTKGNAGWFTSLVVLGVVGVDVKLGDA